MKSLKKPEMIMAFLLLALLRLNRVHHAVRENAIAARAVRVLTVTAIASVYMATEALFQPRNPLEPALGIIVGTLGATFLGAMLENNRRQGLLRDWNRNRPR